MEKLSILDALSLKWALLWHFWLYLRKTSHNRFDQPHSRVLLGFIHLLYDTTCLGTDFWVKHVWGLGWGGFSTDGDAQHTVEVWLPGDRSCQLPRLPPPGRMMHTQSSYTACGGYDTRTSCLTFDGEWEQSHSLSEGKYGHMSWQTHVGTFLMGGFFSNGTELISITDNTTTSGFNLTYDTWYKQ